MCFKKERQTKNVQNCSSCTCNMNVMWKIWHTMEVYVQISVTKHFKCLWELKTNMYTVSYYNICTCTSDRYVVGLSLSMNDHFKCIPYDTYNVNMTHTCSAAMYNVGHSFWKMHEKLRFPMFEHVYVQCIAYAYDNVNLTFTCQMYQDNVNLTYIFTAVIYCETRATKHFMCFLGRKANN